MQSKRSKVSSDFMRNETYNSIKDQLESQNQALLQQRRTIQSRFGNKTKTSHKKKYHPHPKRKGQSQYSITEQQYIEEDYQQPNDRSTFSKTDGEVTSQIKRKIHDVIKMCENDERPGSGEFRDIVEAQKQILSYLQGHETPYKQRRGTQKLTRSKMQKVAGSNKKSIREQISSNGFKHLISDDAMELIDQIERKTLLEIESLRMDKIVLMKKLNQEVHDHNEQKERRMILEERVRQLEQLLGSQKRRKIRATSYPFEKRGKHQGYHEQIVEEPEYSDDEQQQYEDEEEQEQIYEESPEKQSISKKSPKRRSQYDEIVRHPDRIPQKRQTQPPPRRNQPSSQVPQVPPSHFRETQSTGGFGAGNQIQDQIMRLEHQNKRMKQNLSNHSQPFKNQLRSQLSDLQSQIRQYEAVLKNQSTVGSQGLDSLLMNGNSILSQGQKLMKIRSKPEISHNMPESSQMQEIKLLKSRIHDLQQQNRDLNRNGVSSHFESAHKLPSVYTPNRNNHSSSNYFKSQTPQARTPNNKYQSFIEEMRRVAGR